MNLLSDILTYIRRIIKTPSNLSITDNLLIDYVNRFYINDVDARVQLFDLRTKYQFQTTPGVDQYNMPLYSIQTEPGNQNISFYPVYQGFMGPAYVNGVQIPFFTERSQFFSTWPNIVQYSNVVGVGNGTNGPYTLQFPVGPYNSQPLNAPVNAILRGHVDMSGIISTGVNIDPPVGTSFNTSIPVTSAIPAVYLTSQGPDGSNNIVCDSGQFLTGNINLGLLMSQGPAGTYQAGVTGNQPLPNGYTSTQNVFNYVTGVASDVYFPQVIPAGVNILSQCYFYQSGLPRGLLYYNNVITLRTVPSQSWMVELDAYLSPAAFLNSTDPVKFGYMSEYIARGAARKILSDTGDWEQFNAYEPQFLEQEALVWKRSQRQFTSSRTYTIFSQGMGVGWNGFNGQGGNAF